MSPVSVFLVLTLLHAAATTATGMRPMTPGARYVFMALAWILLFLAGCLLGSFIQSGYHG